MSPHDDLETGDVQSHRRRAGILHYLSQWNDGERQAE
jgi:hypothetical protein